MHCLFAYPTTSSSTLQAGTTAGRWTDERHRRAHRASPTSKHRPRVRCSHSPCPLEPSMTRGATTRKPILPEAPKLPSDADRLQLGDPRCRSEKDGAAGGAGAGEFTFPLASARPRTVNCFVMFFLPVCGF